MSSRKEHGSLGKDAVLQCASALGLVCEVLDIETAWEQARSTFLTHAASRHPCGGWRLVFPDLSLQSVLFISYSINRLTGTDGFRVLCHQFAPSSLPRRANCISRSKTCSLTTKHMTSALLRLLANGDQGQNTPHTVFPLNAGR